MNQELIVLHEIIGLRLKNSKGTEFEEFFSSIARNYYKNKNLNFKKVRPQGPIGDRKNDGYVLGEGIFYQVNGPRNNDFVSQSLAEKKIIDDFYLLMEHCKKDLWEPIKKWIFVFNDKGDGEVPTFHKTIKDLQKIHPDIVINWYGIDDIMDYVEDLSHEKLQIIANIGNFDYSKIANPSFFHFDKIFGYLKKNVSQSDFMKFLYGIENYDVNPDLIEKIKFNNLGDSRKNELEVYSQGAFHLSAFFQNSDNTEQQQYGQIFFNNLYSEAKDNCDHSDEIYDDIFSKAYKRDDLSKQDVDIFNTHIKIIMSYYFEGCDIFEPVPLKK